jgi:CelD/BcsL family acetyltransferase involved in cellulose biosynthesis
MKSTTLSHNRTQTILVEPLPHHTFQHEPEERQDQPLCSQIIEGKEGISEFGQHWDDLYARAVDAPAFLSRPWINTYIREGRIKGTPLFILVWSGTKLAAMLALTVRKRLKIKTAIPVSAGEGFYLGLLLDPNYQSAIEYMADTITSGKVFDVYYSMELSSEDRATNELLNTLEQKGFSRRQAFRNVCFHNQLGGSFDEYFRRIASSKSRQNLRRRERRLFESGDVKVEHYTAEEVTPEILLRIAAIEQQSWLKRRGAAALHKPFHQKLLLEMARAGMGCVWLMTINGDDAAFEYVLTSHKNLQFAWRAFKLEYQSSMSIGQIIMMNVIRHACDNDILSMDIGHGESDYKKFWAKENYKAYRIVAARGFRGHLIATSYYLAWRLAEIEQLKSFYRRTKKALRGFRKKAASL